MTDMKDYASALFLLAGEEGLRDKISEELSLLKELLTENPEYTRLLDTPAMKKEERLALAERAFSGFTDCVLNLIMLLSERHLASGLVRVADLYASMYDDACGILRAEAVTAVKMTEEQTARLAARLGEMTAKTVIIKNTVDPSVLGGVKLRYATSQLDGSVMAGLSRFEKALASSVL